MKVIKMTIIMSLALAFAFAAPASPQQGAEPGRQKQSGKQMMTMDEIMIFTYDDHMIETLSANRADDAFGLWILEG
jgi:hypothetical protein